MHSPTIVDEQTWMSARLALLEKEKAFTRLRDELTHQRSEMPAVRVNDPYEFHDSNGAYSLAELFAGKSQLIIYHFMFGPEWKEPCRSCSFWADNFDGIDAHLAQRDIAFVAVSSAPSERLEAFRHRMGWSFRWLSSGACSFNQDFLVAFTAVQMNQEEIYYNYKQQTPMQDEMPGVSVFVKDADANVLHTYSSYSRGLDLLNGAYNYMDLTPKGRDESDGIMRWLRFRDEYT